MPSVACCASLIACVAVARLGLDCGAVRSQPPTSSVTSTDTSERPRTMLRRSAERSKRSSWPPCDERQHRDAQRVLVIAAKALGKRERAQYRATLLARPGRRLRGGVKDRRPPQPHAVG